MWVVVARQQWRSETFKLSERQKLVEPSVQREQAARTSRDLHARCKSSQATPPAKAAFRFDTTLRQTYSLGIQRVQFAFKDSMIHFILQFTLLIATGYVLHRCTSQEIHR